MVEPYLDLLRAGGSRTPEELARVVGLDAPAGLVAPGLGEDHQGLPRGDQGPGRRRQGRDAAVGARPDHLVGGRARQRNLRQNKGRQHPV